MVLEVAGCSVRARWLDAMRKLFTQYVEVLTDFGLPCSHIRPMRVKSGRKLPGGGQQHFDSDDEDDEDTKRVRFQ